MRIRWRPKAVIQLDAIERYIERDNPAAARRMEQLILKSVDLLEAQPALGRPGRVEGTRELIIPGTRYIVAYAIYREEIRVLAVLHAARKWPDRL